MNLKKKLMMEKIRFIGLVILMVIFFSALLIPPWNEARYKKDGTYMTTFFSGWHFWGFKTKLDYNVRWDGVDQLGNRISGIDYSHYTVPKVSFNILSVEIAVILSFSLLLILLTKEKKAKIRGK